MPAPYTRASAVRAIIELDATLPDATVDVLIADAAIIIDDVIGGEATLAGTRLEAVNRWLAAHLLASGIAPRSASEGVKGLTEAFQYRLDKGLATTMYGTQAMQLDTSGKLARWNKQMEEGITPRVSLTYLGSDPPG